MFHSELFSSAFITLLPMLFIGLHRLGGNMTLNYAGQSVGVLRRSKGFVWYDRWTWRGDRASPLKILLTEEGEIDQIFWLRFGKSYLILE